MVRLAKEDEGEQQKHRMRAAAFIAHQVGAFQGAKVPEFDVYLKKLKLSYPGSVQSNESAKSRAEASFNAIRDAFKKPA